MSDLTYIFIDRHPQSKGNETGNHMNDPLLPITELGKEQASAQAEFLMGYFEREGITQMPQIWAGEYTRVREGMDEKLKRMYELNPDFVDFAQVIHADDMLIERHFGDLAYKEHLMNVVFKGDPQAQKAIEADYAKGKAVFDGAPYSSKPGHGESRKEMGAFARHWRASLDRDIDNGQNIHWVMGHGDVNKAIISKQFHWHDLDIWDRIPDMNNCDIVMIKGEPENWSVQKIYDGEKMQAAHGAIVRAKPKTIGDLPFAQTITNE